jgi:uncharacterized protein (TIGR02246 family)
MAEVAVRRLAPEDRALIDDIVARYNRALDTGDKDEFLSVFTEGGVWVSPLMGTFEGHQALGEWFDDYYSKPSDHQYGQHRVTNTIFDKVEDDRVEMWCNWILVSPHHDGPHVTVMGNYYDIIVRKGDRWLFEKRTIEIKAQNG